MDHQAHPDRLIGAFLAEHNETWKERRYLDMEDFGELAAARAVVSEDNNVVVLSN